eukprot:scaffold162909_cov52-Attheya_sp.AAC.2
MMILANSFRLNVSPAYWSHQQADSTQQDSTKKAIICNEKLARSYRYLLLVPYGNTGRYLDKKESLATSSRQQGGSQQ